MYLICGLGCILYLAAKATSALRSIMEWTPASGIPGKPSLSSGNPDPTSRLPVRKWAYKSTGYTPSKQIAQLAGTIAADDKDKAWAVLHLLKRQWSFTTIMFLGLYEIDSDGKVATTPCKYNTETLSREKDDPWTKPRLSSPTIESLESVYTNASWTREYDVPSVFNTINFKDKRSIL